MMGVTSGDNWSYLSGCRLAALVPVPMPRPDGSAGPALTTKNSTSTRSLYGSFGDRGDMKNKRNTRGAPISIRPYTPVARSLGLFGFCPLHRLWK